MSTKPKRTRKEGQSKHESNEKVVKDATNKKKHQKSSTVKDKPPQKDIEEPSQSMQLGGKDPLKDAVFALGGDAQDYELVKDISDGEENLGGIAAAEEDVRNIYATCTWVN